MSQITALGLFSGGLDSILASRVIASLGVRVVAIKFITPFFDDHLRKSEASYRSQVLEKYGIDVRVVDLSKGYIELLRNPEHGFGKHFNPCVDCKIFMLRRARELMEEYNASFLVTGEVLGQRPMSQRRDTLRVIERDSGCDDILLRPLCAKRLKETKPEREGLVDRDKLYGFTGRGRKDQIRLAEEFGISDYPNPAGGCILTDPNLGTRIEQFYAGKFNILNSELGENDIRLLLVGRQFRLPSGVWFILGRNMKENERIEGMAGPGDWLVQMKERPGPTGLLRKAEQAVTGSSIEHEISQQAAGLVVRYGQKIDGGIPPAEVEIKSGTISKNLLSKPLDDATFQEWII